MLFNSLFSPLWSIRYQMTQAEKTILTKLMLLIPNRPPRAASSDHSSADTQSKNAANHSKLQIREQASATPDNRHAERHPAMRQAAFLPITLHIHLVFTFRAQVRGRSRPDSVARYSGAHHRQALLPIDSGPRGRHSPTAVKQEGTPALAHGSRNDRAPNQGAIGRALATQDSPPTTTQSSGLVFSKQVKSYHAPKKPAAIPKIGNQAPKAIST